jgi:hypothetical protein
MNADNVVTFPSKRGARAQQHAEDAAPGREQVVSRLNARFYQLSVDQLQIVELCVAAIARSGA